MTDIAEFVADLNHEYERLHTAKEDAFWTSYMGLSDDPDAARKELDAREVEFKRFLQDPERLGIVREVIAEAEAALESDAEVQRPSADDMTALAGWLANFQAHCIEAESARTLSEEIIADEGALARARGSMRLGYEDPEKGFVEASSVKLATILRTDEDERLRRAAWNGLGDIETHVLENGFLDLVKKRNRLGRELGGEDYYDAKTRMSEGMAKAEIFAMLDELDEQTRSAGERFVRTLRSEHGESASEPWNVRYFSEGDVTALQDPHFPFGQAVVRWGRSFGALGIEYRGAQLVLDLLDRKGKYENGFMHGPVPAWRESGTFRPARLQFTANAIPGMVGSGQRATTTLFHEGGHAADFANTDMPSPCFSHEFPPTSGAFAETQSMFLDSLLEDADWQARYALTESGEPMSFELIEKGIRSNQPSAAWILRSMLAICYAEKAIYELPDEELTASRVLEVMRETERRFTFLAGGSYRPTLSIPHLLAGESSASYHSYLLALMAVHQTRAFFLERDGHLVDNPRIGSDLREHYWKPGNSLGFKDYVENLTGKPLTAEAIGVAMNRTADEAVAEARERIAKLKDIPTALGEPKLDAAIRVVHGNETVAEMKRGGSFFELSADFERWINARRAATTPRA